MNTVCATWEMSCVHLSRGREVAKCCPRGRRLWDSVGTGVTPLQSHVQQPNCHPHPPTLLTLPRAQGSPPSRVTSPLPTSQPQGTGFHALLPPIFQLTDRVHTAPQAHSHSLGRLVWDISVQAQDKECRCSGNALPVDGWLESRTPAPWVVQKQRMARCCPGRPPRPREEPPASLSSLRASY